MKLGEVVLEAKDGGTPPRSNPNNFGGDINWCVVKDIQKEIFESKEKLTWEGINNCSAKVWPAGTIIISLGATIGEVGIARVPTATKQGLAGIVVDETKVIPEFLAYVLRSKKRIIQHMARGGTIKEVRPSRLLKELDVEVPSIDEQKRIAAILDKADDIKQKSDKIPAMRKEIIRSLFYDLFGDPVTNSKRWVVTTIGEQCSVKGGKRVPKGQKLVTKDTGLPYIKAGNIKNGVVNLNKLEFLTPDTHEKIKRYTVDEGDVCITVVGVNIGDVGIVPKALHLANLTENANKLLINYKSQLNNVYLCNYLQTEYAQMQIGKRSMAVGVPKLALFRIKQLKLLLPPIELQNKFAKTLELIEKIPTIQNLVETNSDSITQELLS